MEEEEDQYGMPDPRRFIAPRPNFFPPPDLLPAPNPYDLLVFHSDSAAGPTTANIVAGAGVFESGGAGRWPRQETLTLLEIRSRLDPKFKEANQKGPLWDQVSRIMYEEHGYQRSGKKCREKFENLYKYYKKTKEGKAGRQDGKHYRFFRQLEALYGQNTITNSTNANANANANTDTNNNNYSSVSASEPYRPHPQMNFPNNTSLSLSNCSEPEDTTSSGETKRGGKTGWKARVKDFVDLQMTRLVEKQEAWMEKMVAAVEHKERERALREEEWRKQDTERVEREHRFWAGERAWIEARDAALMEALHKITGRGLMTAGGSIEDVLDGNKVEGLSTPGSVFWEDVGDRMSRLGHDRKEKLDCVNEFVIKCNKKRKENTKSCGFFDDDDIPNRDGDGGVGYEQQGVIEPVMRLGDNQSNNNNNISESCLRYFMGDAYGRII